MKIDELREMLKKLKLRTLDPDEFESENDQIQEDDKYERKIKEQRRCRQKERKTEMQQTSPFTIKNTGKPLSYFTDDNKASIDKWMQDFQDMSTLLQLNNLQMLIYGKPMLQ
ncbi:hypothetical protein ANTQUA_LOCUS8946 [Anthophora quadrimaculata]